ncbi:MAG: helix-turn-helix domain-containing protein [Acidobacteriota bacterium]|nr:helix-turn-helix domain-containing protein [Acidobacteriota bacterium]
MEKNAYTTEEAAARLGVTVGRVRQMIVDGILQTERFGRAHVITKEAIKAAEQRRTKPGPAPKAKPAQSNGKKKGKK